MPRGQRRRSEILAVAERMLLSRGFAETTMQRVAEEAGASKETLYRHFKSKDDLVIEIVVARAGRLRGALDANFDSGAGMAAVLRELGLNLLKAMGEPEVTALLRIVIKETVRNPALGLALYTAGPERTKGLLADYLSAAKRRGEFFGEDTALAASLFIGAAMGNDLLVNLLREPDCARTDAAIAHRVDEAVALFLSRYSGDRPRGAASVAEGR